jgi:MoaA/NifB/PqqE/SkfB family radical SAM enzyme
MCNHWREEVEPPLSTAFWCHVVDDLAQLGTQKIHLTGGEPTLKPDLEDLIAHITTRRIRVTMTSNATLITPKRARSLTQAGLQRINISLDSPDPSIHNQIRGVSEAWEKAVAGFRALRPYLKKGRMQINTVVSATNYKSLIHLPELARQLKADRIHLIPLDPHTPEINVMTPAQIQEYNREVGPLIARWGLAYGVLQNREEAFPFGIKLRDIQASAEGLYARGYYDHHPCFAPWSHALIDHVGQVKICCMMPHDPILGDLRQHSFRDIWTGFAYQQLRQKETFPLMQACRRCDMFLKQNRQLLQLVK